MSNFLKINKSMIFFLEKSSFKKIVYKRPKEYINKTIWVFVSINEFYTYKNFYEEYKKSYEIDVEHFRHNVRLYMIWAEKSNFLRTAALKNYFNSKCFYWTDVGNFRNSSNIDNYINWPSTNKCFEDGRVVINERLNKSDYIKDGLIKFDLNIHREFQKTYNVDGSCFGGKRDYVINGQTSPEEITERKCHGIIHALADKRHGDQWIQKTCRNEYLTDPPAAIHDKSRYNKADCIKRPDQVPIYIGGLWKRIV